MLTVGFDTSNYTTSCAAFDGEAGANYSRLLEVPQGTLGLRQSEALFQHIKRLPELSDRLFAYLDGKAPQAVGVSTRPRAVACSYMPCFLAGERAARLLSAALPVPLIEVSHQQGHIAAALWSAKRLDLLDRPHLAWHLSGGTTELLLIRPKEGNVDCEIIGGTTDISAGQLIDRTGKLLGLPFPSGKALDALAEGVRTESPFRVRVTGASFSFSGLQNKTEELYRSAQDRACTAAFALDTVVEAVLVATRNALQLHPGLPVVFSGGVSSNRRLRERCDGFEAIFPEPAYSTDNAMGVAVLAARLAEMAGV